jgi:hypothetical protein
MARSLPLVALLGVLWAPAWASPSSSTTGRLEGVVTGQRYGLALPSVSVTLRAWRPQVHAGETLPLVEVRQTDRDGTFAFDDLPAGLYSIEAVPGLAVTEHLVLAETPRPYRPPPPRT